MVMHGSIPFGTMYCTYTQSYCTELGLTLDDEQLALDFVKAIKKKDDSIRTMYGRTENLEKSQEA